MVFLILPAAADIPGPHDLPDPDTTPPDSTKPVKVYILSGQSNMMGVGYVTDPDPGSLSTVTTDGLFPHMLDAAGAWTVRNDVWYEGRISATAKKWLTVGCGNGSDKIGPELQFGHIMGYYHDEPVILLKVSIGNRALGWDILPPGSVQYDSDDGYTYPGYGGSPERWLIGTDPVPIEWYAGKTYDRYVAEAKGVLDNFDTKFPQWAAQGYEIAGFAWWQGHRDGGMKGHADRYELNMVNLIKAWRAEFGAPNAPFVIATIGFGGWTMSGNQLTVANAQLAVSGETGNYPEFEGNVKTVESRDYWREVAESPGNQGYHYNNNAWTYMMVGDALGRAMAEILTPYSVNAGDDMITWSGQAIDLEATIQDGVTVTSYAWSADPAAGVLFSDPAIEDPTVTITKATDNPSTVTVTLTVNDGVNPPVPDSIRIDVYDDACKATIGEGLAADNPTDLNGDCVTGLEDLAVMALAWLNDNGLAAPVLK
ncbi:MAG: hypothetical protein IIC00_15930 [Planctomycetes bacterium]|nr:hypothetical protein [Planctomycetota bacterium]